MPATPPPPAGIRTRGGCSYGGLGLLRYVSCRSTAPVRNGFATTPPPAGIRTRGGCSYGGFGLLRYVLRRSTAPGAKRVCRQLHRRRLAFAPGAGAPTV